MSGEIEALLSYVSDKVVDPAIYNYRPEPGAPDRSPEQINYRMVMTDVRSYGEALFLDRQGVQVARLSSRVSDYYDDDQIRNNYYPEIEKLVMDATGAQHVVAFDYNVRCQNYAEQKKYKAQRPVRFVHNDYTHHSGPQRVRDLMGDTAEALLKKRFAVINAWKPIVGPVRKSPLAVCDATTMAEQDFVKTALLYRDRQGEIYTVRHRQQHRWFYVSGMGADEVMLLKCYDSALDGRARYTAHTAFEDPRSPADAPDRESIEVRTLVFFDR